MSLLELERLGVRYGAHAALTDVSLRMAAGEIMALVGRSGSGKSTLAMAILGLSPPSAEVTGRVLVDGREVGRLATAALRALRGGWVGTVFQEPATALNPALTIGRQIDEVLAAHGETDRRAREAEVARLLARVGLDVPPTRYPHMLSGGQRQRVAIAMAITAGPALLVADEPTAALDPLARRGIVELLTGLVRERGMGLLLISHDLPLVAAVADRIAVLDEGRLVEEGTLRERLAAPSSPALAAMVAAERPIPLPSGGKGPPLLTIERLWRSYPASARLFEGRRTTALADVSLSLREGETLAVVGASGSGKTTLARAALGLERPDRGDVRIGGCGWRGGWRDRPLRRQVQAVFQDPADSLDPRMTVAEIVAEPLHLLDPRPDPAEAARRVAAALTEVGLDAAMAGRRPGTFSGGQRQRIALARALILRPKLVVLDEALSALDPELRRETVALLIRLQAEHGIAYLFISHDMGLVRQVAHSVAVLREGWVVAQGRVAELLDGRADPYVAELVSTAPTLPEALVKRTTSSPA